MVRDWIAVTRNDMIGRPCSARASPWRVPDGVARDTTRTTGNVVGAVDLGDEFSTMQLRHRDEGGIILT